MYSLIIFYHFTEIENPKLFLSEMTAFGNSKNLKGRILISDHGINGTLEGSIENVEHFKGWLIENSFGDFSDIWFKQREGDGKSFRKWKVKLKPELLNSGLEKEEYLSCVKNTATHLDSNTLREWYKNEDDFEVLDMRNDYEYEVGHFKNSHKSGMRFFRDLQNLLPNYEALKKKKLVTVCTYGIRCEIASGYLKKQGFENVYQLSGGIGTYMKEFKGEDFLGSLYVFDERLTEQFTNDYQKIGKCFVCKSSSERYGNCANHDCHKQLIICENCKEESVFCEIECKKTSQIEMLS